ncbi:GroES-like protein [Gloeophyllum trabeum ATCC 11539]|uniref:GroES-like protein n=1 Tax=Gloeophyllum trabeum (strain ATCC 11539 / FP-39264 / Madison 617) TaxID=670483 RepID=S7PV29_GLOTA|nr:GroES-like protein [Gloeophyllum trabeum ATCC 11539]EPQ51237.1 GroES-like protein [Gloeophyllum trabeum ATCC 11539]
MSQVEFKGYAALDGQSWGGLKVIDIKPKTWKETDVEITITHCGRVARVCGSDVHTITEGWGKVPFPLVVGHEIVGKVTRVGSEVKDLKVGDRAGVGALIGGCYSCRACRSDNENYCPRSVLTYADRYPDGMVTQGGYASAIRAHEQFVFPIPDGVESRDAASMLCGGLTIYSPLKRNGAGPGKKVGIVGIGGIGHYGILFGKAMGAEVYAFTHDESKVEDIKKMGADHGDFAKPLARTLDLIISTRDVAEGMPLQQYLSMLWVHGKFITVGLPDGPLPQLSAFDLNPNGCFLGGSRVGSKREAAEMLGLAAEKGIRPWIEEMPMREAAQAIQRLKRNDVRYRFVLTQDLV